MYHGCPAVIEYCVVSRSKTGAEFRSVLSSSDSKRKFRFGLNLLRELLVLPASLDFLEQDRPWENENRVRKGNERVKRLEKDMSSYF